MKRFEIIQAMRRLNVDILCMQETRIKQSPFYTTEDGYLIIFSGSTGEDREFAGVGFIVAPQARHAVIGFLQH